MEKLKAKQIASNLTEAEAIKHVQAGNAAAFEFPYKAYCRRVYSVCLRMIKNPAEAEGLTQQVFLQLFRKIGTFRGESGFSTWLHRVTVNIVLMHLRRKKTTEILAEDFERHSSNREGPREHGSSDTICKSPASVESNTLAIPTLESRGEGEPQDGENSLNFNMRRHLVRCTSLIIFLVLAFVIPQIASAADDDDPPGRVARLSYISGAVSFNPAGTDDWP